MPITKQDAPDVLPSHAKEIYASAFNNAYATTCKKREDRDECGAKIAWSAVKRKYKRTADGKWVAKSLLETLAVVKTDTSNPDRIGGYLVMWGNEDLRDKVDEFFTPDTDFWLGTWPQLPMLYHHGFNEVEGLRGRKSVVGKWDTFEEDDVGLWVEGELEKRHKYREGLDALITEKALGLSSGAFPKFVQVESNGFIKAWPIVEGSLTTTPMEPRMADVGFLKSAFNINLDAVERVAEEVKKMGEEEVSKGLSFLEKLGKLSSLFTTSDEVVDEVVDAENDTDKSVAEPVAESAPEVAPESTPEVSEDTIKAIAEVVGNQVGQVLGDALKSVEASTGELRSELDQVKEQVANLVECLSAREKSVEERVAEAIESLPPAVRAPVSESVASVADESLIPPDESKINSWLQQVVIPFVKDGLSNDFTTQPLVE